MTKVIKYTLRQDYQFSFIKFSRNLKKRIEREFGDKPSVIEKKYRLSKKNLYIYNDYSWNGSSPKIKFLRWFIGTPDGRDDQMYYPTLLHDILYQTCRLHPLSRKTVDLMFYELMKLQNWKFSKLYYSAVRIFGGIFHIITHRKD